MDSRRTDALRFTAATLAVATPFERQELIFAADRLLAAAYGKMEDQRARRDLAKRLLDTDRPTTVVDDYQADKKYYAMSAFTEKRIAEGRVLTAADPAQARAIFQAWKEEDQKDRARELERDTELIERKVAYVDLDLLRTCLQKALDMEGSAAANGPGHALLEYLELLLGPAKTP